MGGHIAHFSFMQKDQNLLPVTDLHVMFAFL